MNGTRRSVGQQSEFKGFRRAGRSAKTTSTLLTWLISNSFDAVVLNRLIFVLFVGCLKEEEKNIIRKTICRTDGAYGEENEGRGASRRIRDACRVFIRSRARTLVDGVGSGRQYGDVVLECWWLEEERPDDRRFSTATASASAPSFGSGRWRRWRGRAGSSFRARSRRGHLRSIPSRIQCGHGDAREMSTARSVARQRGPDGTAIGFFSLVVPYRRCGVTSVRRSYQRRRCFIIYGVSRVIRPDRDRFPGVDRARHPSSRRLFPLQGFAAPTFSEK